MLGQVGVNEALVISAGHEADLLGIRLLGQSQMMLPGEFAHLRLAHVAEWKAGAAELVLGKAEKEVSLILCWIGGAAKQPAVARRIETATRVVPGGQKNGADLAPPRP